MDDQHQHEDIDQLEMSTEERLREFEDKMLGKDHARIHGKLERGRGSVFQSNPENGSWGPKHREHHAALEALIEVEREHERANAAASAAHAKLEAAIKRVSETGKDL